MNLVTEISKRYLPMMGLIAMAFGFVNCDRNHGFSKQEDNLVISTQPVTNVVETDVPSTTPNNNTNNYEPPGDDIGSGSGDAVIVVAVNTSSAETSGVSKALSEGRILMVSLQGEFYNSSNWDLLSDNSATERYAVLTLPSQGQVFGSNQVFGSFSGLSEYDLAGTDKLINSEDAIFYKLRLWLDNGNGSAVGDEASTELISLEEAGIESLSLRSTNAYGEDIDGTLYENKAVVRFVDPDPTDSIVRRGIISDKRAQ